MYRGLFNNRIIIKRVKPLFMQKDIDMCIDPPIVSHFEWINMIATKRNVRNVNKYSLRLYYQLHMKIMTDGFIGINPL